jgi:hypothetical protein
VLHCITCSGVRESSTPVGSSLNQACKRSTYIINTFSISAYLSYLSNKRGSLIITKLTYLALINLFRTFVVEELYFTRSRMCRQNLSMSKKGMHCMVSNFADFISVLIVHTIIYYTDFCFSVSSIVCFSNGISFVFGEVNKWETSECA